MRHRQGEPALPVQDFGSTGTRAKKFGKVILAVTGRLHAKPDRVNRVGGLYWPMPRFIGFDQVGEHVETIAGRRPRLRLIDEIAFDLGKGGPQS